APFVQTFVRTTPTATPTNAASLTYTIAFSEPVTGVDVADFKLTKTGVVVAAVTQVAPSGGSGGLYAVTVSAVGDRTACINFVADNSVRDPAGNPLVSASPTTAFKPAVTTSLALGSATIPAADFDSDGKIDIAAADEFGSGFYLYLGNGDGTFRNSGFSNA